MSALIEAVPRNASIRVIEGYAAEALLTRTARSRDFSCAKSATRWQNLDHCVARGCCDRWHRHLYAVTTNPAEASGLGLAIAARAGAIDRRSGFVQFHPTAHHGRRDPAPAGDRSIARRSATLINDKGERFMQAQHRLAELAPPDIVARGVFAEIAAGRGVFLDATKGARRAFR